VDRRQRIAHFMRDRCGQTSHRGELHLLRLDLRAAEILEVDECAAVETRADAHQTHAQQALRRLDLERWQRLVVVFLPAAPLTAHPTAVRLGSGTGAIRTASTAPSRYPKRPSAFAASSLRRRVAGAAGSRSNRPCRPRPSSPSECTARSGLATSTRGVAVGWD